MASALVFDPADPYAYAEVRGTATVTEDPRAELIDELAVKYTGEPFRDLEPGERRIKYTIEPDRVLGPAARNQLPA